jgi:ABC-type uncharacterized transport system permease subunit
MGIPVTLPAVPLLSLLQLLAALLYGGAAVLQWRAARADREQRPGLWLATAALIVHTVALGGQIYAGDGQLNLDLAYALSLFLWLAVVQFLLGSLYIPVQLLGIGLLPLAGLALLVEAFAPTGHSLVIDLGRPALLTHLLVSLLAYGTLTLAALQAVLLAIQDASLRRKRPGLLSRVLPPLQPMERLLFHLIRTGFVFLTLVIVSGAIFSEQIFGQPLTFNHKVVLSLAAWLVFGALLVGHARFGWRGRTAVGWTLSGYGILLLAYFGVRVVLELKA